MVARFKDEYVTVAEAAELLGVAQSTIRRWIREERVPAYRLGDRRILLRRHDLEGLAVPIYPLKEVDLSLRPPLMTDEEQARAWEALRKLDEFVAEIMKERGGKPFRSVVEDIREMREERTRELP
jgi:excisionase family DNA binding protein